MASNTLALRIPNSHVPDASEYLYTECSSVAYLRMHDGPRRTKIATFVSLKSPFWPILAFS